MFNKPGIFLFFLIPFVMMSFFATKFAYHDDQRPRKETNTCKVIRILCFGDSLTSGFVNPKTFQIYPYSTKLQEYFDLHNRTVLGASLQPIFEVHNAGIPGGFAKDQMLPRLYRILHRSIVKYSWVIILGGTNDLNSVKPRKSNLSDDSRSIFNAIVKLHNITHDFGARSVVVTIPDRECEGLGTCANLRETQKKINQFLRDFTANSKGKALLADFAREVYLPRDRRLWSDSVHFTQQGYEKMADIIYNAMKEHV